MRPSSKKRVRHWLDRGNFGSNPRVYSPLFQPQLRFHPWLAWTTVECSTVTPVLRAVCFNARQVAFLLPEIIRRARSLRPYFWKCTLYIVHINSRGARLNLHRWFRTWKRLFPNFSRVSLFFNLLFFENTKVVQHQLRKNCLNIEVGQIKPTP